MEPATVSGRAIGTLNTLIDKDSGYWSAGGSLGSAINFSENNTKLHVKGKLVAIIEATAPIFSSPPKGTNNDVFFLDKGLVDLDFENVMAHFRSAWESFNLLLDSPSTLGFITAFWLEPRGPVLSAMASWLGDSGNERLKNIREEYEAQLIDHFMSIHFH